MSTTEQKLKLVIVGGWKSIPLASDDRLLRRGIRTNFLHGPLSRSYPTAQLNQLAM
jgi:hypothetical protein